MVMTSRPSGISGRQSDPNHSKEKMTMKCSGLDTIQGKLFATMTVVTGTDTVNGMTVAGDNTLTITQTTDQGPVMDQSRRNSK